MLETFVSSRIRRALFEYILLHSTERFYLRGLAKDLGVSISPLRRELKRLERGGMLYAVQEGNILFYTVNTASSMFLQLHQVGQEPQPLAPYASQPAVAVQPLSITPALQQPTRVVPRAARLWRVAGVSMAMLLVTVGLTSMLVGRSPQIAQPLTTHRAEMMPVVGPATGSGVMHGSRWRIEPGGVGGGFSVGSGD